MTVEQAKEANTLAEQIKGIDVIVHGLPIETGRKPCDHISIYPIFKDKSGREYSGNRVDVPMSVLSLSKLKDILVDYKNSLTDQLSKM